MNIPVASSCPVRFESDVLRDLSNQFEAQCSTYYADDDVLMKSSEETDEELDIANSEAIQDETVELDIYPSSGNPEPTETPKQYPSLADVHTSWISKVYSIDISYRVFLLLCFIALCICLLSCVIFPIHTFYLEYSEILLVR